MTYEEIRDEILEKDSNEFTEMIEVVMDGIFSHYSEEELNEIGFSFAQNSIDTSAICRLKRPK